MNIRILWYVIWCTTSTALICDVKTVPPTFGKTHFIIGNSKTVKKRTARSKPSYKKTPIKTDIPFNLVTDDGTVKAVYFAPHDDVHAMILYLIEQETQKIRIAMFAFTDIKIANALAAAQARGVQVEVLTDPSTLYSRYSKFPVLHAGKVQLFVYNPSRTKKSTPSTMHHKFVLFERNILNKSLILTGSFNFTRAAHTNNQENLLVL